MKIIQLDAATTLLTNREIEVGVHKLAFDLQATAGTVLAALPSNINGADITMLNARRVLAALIGDCVITLSKQDGHSTELLQPKLRLADVAEMSTNNEGMIRMFGNLGIGILGAVIAPVISPFDNGEGVGGAEYGRVRFTLEVSNAGSFKLNDDAKLILNIENKPLGSLMTISTIDHPNLTGEFIKYESKFINANVEKEFDLTHVDNVALPIDIIDSLSMYYENGKEVVMTQDEIRHNLLDSQDEVVNLNGSTVYGYLDFAVLSVVHCHKMKLVLTASENFYFIKTMSV